MRCPIDVLTSEDLQSSGSRTVEELMRTRPEFGSLGTSLAAPTSDVASTELNLRGLGSAYTLTLLNGRRFSVNGAPNVAVIPYEAIDRIEVLKSGASAIYGADAVTGVVNLVLKKSADGPGISTRYAKGTDGYDETLLTGYFGDRQDRSSFFILGNYYERGSIPGISRRPFASNDKRPLGGIDLRSSFGIPAPIDLPTGERVIINTDVVPVGQTSLDPADFRPYDQDRDAHDRVPDQNLNALQAVRISSVIANGTFDISDATKLSVEVLGARVEQSNQRSGSATTLLDVPASNPYNPFGVAVQARYRAIDRDGMAQPRQIQTDSISSGIELEQALGAKFKLNVSANYFRDDTTYTDTNAYFIDGLADALARPGLDAFNPFGNRANSAAQLAGVIVETGTDTVTDLQEFDAHVTGELFSLWAGPVQSVFGATTRKEDLRYTPDAFLQLGKIADAGGATSEFLGDRSVNEAYAEFRVPLIAARDDEVDPVLEATFAGRYSDFSDVGDSVDPLVSMKWQATRSLAVRASYNTSFKPPFLEDLNPSTVASEARVYDPVSATDIETIVFTGGSADLVPETASTTSLGLVFQPVAVPGLFVSADFFKIAQRDLIIAPDPQDIILGLAPGQVLRGDDIGIGGEDVIIYALLTNVAERNVEGLDLSTSYSHRLAGGSELRLNLAASRLLKLETDVVGGDPVDISGTYSPTFGGLPSWKASGAATWEIPPARGDGDREPCGQL